jgi:hypothetical protein
VIEDHGKKKKNGAEEFGEGSDPGDGLGVDGVEGEAEGSPKSEDGSVEGSDEQIYQGDYGWVQKDVDEMPTDGVLAKELELRDVGKKLERTIVIGANVGFCLSLTRKVPDFSSENLAEVLAFEDDGILEDLEFVVGDEVVAEGGGVEGKREEDEDGEMEEAGAVRSWRRWNDVRRRYDGAGRWALLRVFAFPGQDYGSLTQGWGERKIEKKEQRA